MADKQRRLYPLAAIFSAGEQPSAAKLSAISTQAKAAVDKIEYLLGDLWNAAGDLILSPSGNITKNALHIPNLARSIGKLSALNERIPSQQPLSDSILYVDPVGDRYEGENEAWLTYESFNIPSGANMTLAGTFAPLVQIQFKTNPTDIVATGDWSVDETGKLYTFDPIPSTLKITYNPRISGTYTGLDGSAEPGWNVIPDPTTWGGDYDGVKISFANNADASDGYHVWLPPRMPLVDPTRAVYNSPVATSDNIQTVPDVGNLLAYQDGGSNAALTNGVHYRYNLPNEITGGAANSQLPTGFLYLWDEEFGTVVESAVYYTPANTAHSKFKFRMVGADLENVFGDAIGNGIITDDDTQIPADYITRFKVITVGTSLAKAVSNLISFFADHTHSNINGSKAIPHSQLDNLVTPSDSTHYPGPGDVPTFTPSFWTNDDHTQYLHRGGSTGNPSTFRDAKDNAVWNHLVVRMLEGDAFGGQDAFLHFELNDTDGISDTGHTYITAENAGLQLSSFGTGTSLSLTTSYSTQRCGVFIGINEFFGWTGENQTNPDTLLVRGGGTTGIAQLKNAQFEKIYLGPDTNFSRTTSYLVWDNTDKILDLRADSAPDVAMFEAPHIVGSVDVVGVAVTAGTGGFTYIDPPMQYLHINSAEAILEGTSVLRFGNAYIYNDSTGSIFTVFIPVKFPNGASLTTDPDSIKLWLNSNGTDPITVELLAAAKPAAGGYSFWPTTSLMTASTTSAATALVSTTYSSSHTVDNSFTGNDYYITIELPVKISSDQPRFWGMTFSYLLPQVNN